MPRSTRSWGCGDRFAFLDANTLYSPTVRSVLLELGLHDDVDRRPRWHPTKPERLLNLMDTPSSSMRDLARRLLAAASQTDSGPHVHEVVAVSERLRISLAKFAGDAGFASLLRRALVLASADVPSLQSVKIGADGRLDGFEQLAANTGTGLLGDEAAVAITAHLLGLLAAFIGETLTLKLLRESWPDTLITLKDREAEQ